MINKRLLVKNLLAHNGENSFYDNKRSIDISAREGKGKFLKHVCALANSNPNNNSYIVIGIEDENNEIIGVDFFDDSKIQNLINAYLINPPLITYENIPFPNLPEGKVVGLVTVRSIGEICSLKKKIWKYYGGMVFFREGSNSKPRSYDIEIKDNNSKRVATIEKHARNNIEYTLDGVIDFLNNRHKDLESNYKVFKDHFVVCWAGNKKIINGETFFSRVDIELINEQVKLFFSTLDDVKISYKEDEFAIIEYVQLGIKKQQKHYPLEENFITFSENGSYKIESNLIFEAPQFDKKILHHVFNTNNILIEKLKKGISLSKEEEEDLYGFPDTHLICYLNGFESAKETLELARPILKPYNGEIYASLKKSLRVLRKVRYN